MLLTNKGGRGGGEIGGVRAASLQAKIVLASSSLTQILEFVAETRILAKMKIEKSRKNIFSVDKKSRSILFFFYEDDGSVNAN